MLSPNVPGAIVKQVVIALALLQITPNLRAADAPVPIEMFAQLSRVADAELSPNGKFFAYFRPVEGRRYLVVQPIHSTDRPFVLPPPGDLEFSWLSWANDERIVFSMRYSGKREKTETTETRLLSMRYDATDVVPLIKPGRRETTSLRRGSPFFPPPQIQDDVIDWLPGDSNHILVSVDENLNAQDEVRRVDVRTGDYEIVHRESRGIQRWVTDQDHSVRMGFGYDPISGFKITMRTPGGGWKNVGDEDGWASRLRPVAFSSDPSVLYVIGPDEHGLETVSRFSVDSGEILESVFAHETIDAGGIVLDQESGRPVGVHYVDDFPRVHYFDAEYQVLQRSLDRALPDTVNRIISTSTDRQRILVRAFSDVVPGTYLLWDREAGRMDFIAERMPGLSAENLSPVESHWIETPDGVRFEAFLTLPTSGESSALPTIVLPHGGPASRDDRSFWFLTQFLASRGYAVLQPNFRGSTGYGSDFQDAGNKQWGGLMQEDVSTSAHWLVSEGIADPERMCIVGWSYGGYAAAMGVIQTPELYRCAVSINGVLNLPRLLGSARRYIGGTEWTEHIGLDESRAADVSPFHQAKHIEDPMLVIQAKDDTRVHVEQGRNFSTRMEQLDKDIEYVEVEFGGHTMTNEAARLSILSNVEAFLDKHLAR